MFGDGLYEFLFGPGPIVEVQQFFGYGKQWIFEAFSMLGDTWGVVLIMGAAMWIWGRETAYPLFVVIILSALAKELTNLTVYAPRPSGESIVIYEEIHPPSFPSGHVLTAVCAWTYLSIRERFTVFIPIAVAVLVSLGRIYLGAHHVGDVIAGAVLGAVLGIVHPRFWKAVLPWLERRSYRFYVVIGCVVVAVQSFNLATNPDLWHRWSVTGAAIGLTVGLLLQYRSHAEMRCRRGVAVGVAVLILIALPVPLTDPLAVNLVCAAAGAIWVVYLAPVCAERVCVLHARNGPGA